MVCEHSEILASGCGISRAFPVYNQKSGVDNKDQTVQVGFIPLSTPFAGEEANCLNDLCQGIRLAQEIVDAPTNFMHTDAFLDVSV